MKNFPLISIVISTYNQEAYLGECIQALVDDLYDTNSEIIVADDCSTDQTKKIAKSYADNYPKLVRLMSSEINLGANKNYLRAHAAARGKYVAHIDGDDISMPGKIYRQMNVMEKNPNINLVLHSAEYFSDSGKTIFLTGITNPENSEWFFLQSDLACWGPIAVHSSFMYRRKALNLDKVPLPFMEWSIAMNALSQGNGIFINERLIRYRYNPGGSAWTSSVKGRQVAYDIQWENIRHFFDIYPELRTSLYSQVITNGFGILRGGCKLPRGMLGWAFKQSLYLRITLIIISMQMRWELAPYVK
ncbi:glycosyltransferase [Polynucleobacter paneuropaeus]|nr:glycosyltransferase [Polynucleobacter paneuropaeus]